MLLPLQPDKTSKLRHSVRLKNFDYRQPGYYFVTICSYDKKCIFGKIELDSVQLSTLGSIVQDNWLCIPVLNEHVRLDQFIIMPNHLHGILHFCDLPFQKSLGAISKDNSKRINWTTAGSLPTIIRSFKAACTKACQQKLQAEHVWQRGYFEHVIRSESALFKIRQYICDNPIKWYLDELFQSE